MKGRHAALLAALAAIWGGSYLLIKYALEDFDAPFVVFARMALAALVLAALAPREARRALADARRRPAMAAWLGFVSIALPFLLITFAELEIPSGLTAVLVAPASIFVAMLAPLVDPTERAGRQGAIGMVLGLLGVALLVGVESVSSLPEFLGAMGALGASVCYAVSSFVVKGSYRDLGPIATSFTSISVAALMTLPLALFTLPDHAPSLRAVLAVVALGAVGTALAFAIFYRLIAETGAARASLVSYLAPGVALLYGALLLDEAITVAAIAGLALILGGVALASRRGAAPAELTQETAGAR